MSTTLPIQDANSPQGRLARPPLFLWLLTLVAFFLRFGYVYASGDQDEFLPAAMALLDDGLFANDWITQEVLSGINVRTAFVWLLALGGSFLPLWVWAAVLYALTWIAAVWGVYAIAMALFESEISAIIATFSSLVLTNTFTLGMNSLAYNTLAPGSIAWALILLALGYFFNRRLLISGILLGVACWFQLLAGGLTAGVLLCAITGQSLSRNALFKYKELARFAVTLFVVALPIAVPVGLEQIQRAPASGEPDAFFIYSVFRIPWHQLFFSFSVASQIKFWILISLGVYAGFQLQKSSRSVSKWIPILWRALAICGVLWCIAIIFVELIPIPFIAKLQLFKLTVPCGGLATILIVGWVVDVIPKSGREWAEHVLRMRNSLTSLSVVLAAVVAYFAILPSGPLSFRMRPIAHNHSTLGEAERWALDHTEPHALFAIPPSNDTFRSNARRAVASNWKAVVFSEAGTYEWYDRLMDFAPIATPERGSYPVYDLDDSFHANNSERWLELISEYQLDYVLVVAGQTVLPFQVAFRNDDWTILRVNGGAN